MFMNIIHLRQGMRILSLGYLFDFGLFMLNFTFTNQVLLVIIYKDRPEK